MTEPQEISQRVRRIWEYHQSSKLPSEQGIGGDAPQPSPFRVFEDLPRVDLPTNLIGADTPVISLLRGGLDSVPTSQRQPPQDLRTLATWLYLGGGNIRRTAGRKPMWLRTCPSEDGIYPCEIYVAAFGIDGLEPGLYHFCVREFALHRLRDGGATLAQIKRGRPDLEFLKTLPAVLLVSTIFARSSWRYARRGYRHALIDAGRLVQNLSIAGTGMGIQTLVRLTTNAKTMNELIGVAPEAPFAQAEAVQGMVIWADPATNPLPAQAGRSAGAAKMPALARSPLAENIVAYDLIPAIHQDCVAPGVAVREVRPPLTELSPLPSNFPVEEFPAGGDENSDENYEKGRALDKLLLAVDAPRAFGPTPIAREGLWNICRASFRWGASYPLFPDGPHVALVRPLWIIRNVVGVDSGLWYYNPATDEWSCLRRGDFGREAQGLAMSNPLFANAGAVCFMIANLHRLMTEGGPDLYRLAHLESGAAAQRLSLSSRALDLECCVSGFFADDEIRRFFGLEQTVWQPLNVVAIGSALEK